MARIDSFGDLEVWQLAMDLAVDGYKLTTGHPPEERFALSRDTHRSAVICDGSSNAQKGAAPGPPWSQAFSS